MQPVILVDGKCVLCSRTALWLLRWDKGGLFRFGTLQEQPELCRSHGLDPHGMESIVVLTDAGALLKSDALIFIACSLFGSRLGGSPALPWWLRPLRWIPRKIRDAIYSCISRNRYRLFGRSKECMVAPPEWRDRFL